MNGTFADPIELSLIIPAYNEEALLGATVQEVRFCDACRRESELRVHDCGQQTRPSRGVRWCDNDVVNAIATAAGAGVAMAVSRLAFDHAEFDKA